MSKQKHNGVADIFDEAFGLFNDQTKENNASDTSNVNNEKEQFKKRETIEVEKNQQIKPVVKNNKKKQKKETAADGVQVMFYCYPEFKKEFLYFQIKNEYKSSDELLDKAIELALKKTKIRLKYDVLDKIDDESKTINWVMSKDMHKKVKLACIENDISLAEYVRQAVADFIGWQKLL